MNEKEWAQSVQELVNKDLSARDPNLVMWEGRSLPYANEIRSYKDMAPCITDTVPYETDLLVVEKTGADEWTPRIVVECKIQTVTTHDAITYSEKAFTHKKVHPYLRYGILLGAREHYPLPGRLVRHGAYFDFMVSWEAEVPTKTELNQIA